MILFRENGRLGNQIFQYCGLRTMAKKNERLCLFGFNDLQSVFTDIDAEIINEHAKKYKRAFYYRLYKYSEILSKRNFLPTITENINRDIVVTKAPIQKIKFAKELFLQSKKKFSLSVVNRLRIHQHLLDQSKFILSKEVGDEYQPIFVHVRRGDYHNWPDPDYPAILSSEYYRVSISLIKEKLPLPYFIFTSDDSDYVRNEFADIRPKYVSENSFGTDFVIMTQCQGGILSASSFSWWAAYLLHKSNNHSLLIAPKYWIGHRRKEWYPKNIKLDCFKYVEVN